SELDLDWPLRRVEARPHDLPLLARDLAVAKVTDLARAESANARVADPFAAAERKLEPGLLSLYEDRLGSIGLHLGVALEEGDRAALTGLAPADLRLEALHVQLVGEVVALPVLRQRVQHVAGPGGEQLTLAPVGAELVEV